MKSSSIVFMAIALSACVSQKPVPFKPYAARERALVQSVSFSPDGSRMYCTLFHQMMRQHAGDTSKAYPEVAIYEAVKTGGEWGDPVLMSFSGEYEDYEPTVSPDGNYIFYNSKRPLSKGGKASEKNNIWYVQKNGAGWSEPRYYSAANTTDFGEDYPAITKNRTVYFMKEMPSPLSDTISRWRIYAADFPGSGTAAATPVFGNESGMEQGDPWVDPDETYLIFTMFDIGKGWDKTCDLYISFRRNNKWSAPMPLDDLNTANAPDYAVAVSPDEKWIYYRANHYLVRRPFKAVLRKYRKQAVHG